MVPLQGHTLHRGIENVGFKPIWYKPHLESHNDSVTFVYSQLSEQGCKPSLVRVRPMTFFYRLGWVHGFLSEDHTVNS